MPGAEDKVDRSSDAGGSNEYAVERGVDGQDVVGTKRSVGVSESAADGEAAGKCSIHTQIYGLEGKLLTPQLEQLYTWLANLPAWLQERMLSYTPIQALIEVAEQAAVIYDSKYIISHLENLLACAKSEVSTVDPQDNSASRAAVATTASEGLVDTDLVLDGPYVIDWILPTAWSADILPEPIFNGFEVY